MKNIFLFSLSLLIAILAVTGCAKDSFRTLQDKQKIQDRGGCTGGFSSSEIDSIGIMHNQVVTTVFGNFNFSALNPITELKSRFAVEYSGISSTTLNGYFTSGGSGFDIDANISQFSDQNLVSTYFNDIIYYIDNSANMTSLQTSLSTLKGLAETNLACSDLDFILVCISVASNSADLWSPTTIGGDGFYDTIDGLKIISGEVQSRWIWRDVVKGDLTGAAGAFFAYGFGLAIPGANAAIAADIAFASAYGSASSML